MSATSLPSRPSLTDGPIAKTLVFFSLPILFGNMLQSLNGSVNAIWVGHYLGEAALTATANANTVLFFLISSIFGVGMAATILVGQSIGARDTDLAKRVVGTSTTFFVALSLLVALLGFALSNPLMRWMHMPADALPLAVIYLRIIFLGVPFMFTYTFVMMVLRGAGDSKTPFVFLVLSVILDIGLNPLLIFGWGPIPALGIAGSATATLIAQVVSLLGLITYLYRSKHFLCIHRGEGHYLHIDRAILATLTGKGIPMGLQMIVISLSMIMMISLVNQFGSHTAAAYGACIQLWNYIQMPAFAVGAAVSSMAAQNVGAKLWDRVTRTAVIGVAYNFIMTGGLVVLIYLFNRDALSLFLPEDGAAIRIAQHLNAIVVWSFVFFGVTFVISGVVRSTGAVMAPLIILFISMWLLRIPFAYFFLERWGADAIWWSFPLGALASMVLSIAYYRYGGWKNAHMLRLNPAP